jgi:hypothetical protein
MKYVDRLNERPLAWVLLGFTAAVAAYYCYLFFASMSW